MTEAIYICLGIGIYVLTGLAIGMPAVVIWMHWASKEIGHFWDYSLTRAMELYYPRAWSLMASKAYRVIAAMLWPVMLPWMMVLWTKSLVKNRDFEEMMTRLVSR